LDEDDGGVEVGDIDRLFGNTYGVASIELSETFCSSTGKRPTNDISFDVTDGDSTKLGECEAELEPVGTPESPPEELLCAIDCAHGVSRLEP
jgi:hypothetical protein